MKQHFVTAVCSAAMLAASMLPLHITAADTAHDPSRNVQTEGVGNPFNFGDRNTPANASTAEIRAINHKMTVQEVKYALYKEIDEHWDLITVRFGQTDREKVYALFLGIGSRESTLGGNGDGADIETAFSEGFGVSSAHAYGTLQTAVTAFQDPGTSFMPEDDVPEMEWYMLNESNFYDAIISDHMGVRKIIHFIRSAIVDYDLSGYQVVRGALKGFNTGWANYTGDNEGYYKDYPDEIIALARWYYEEGHLYDNTFTWTNAPVAEQYRNIGTWSDWWYDTEPSLAEITEQPQVTVTTSAQTTTTAAETTTTFTSITVTTVATTASATTTTTSQTTPPPVPVLILGDVNLNEAVEIDDAVLLCKYLGTTETFTDQQALRGDMNGDGKLNAADLTLLKRYLLRVR